MVFLQVFLLLLSAVPKVQASKWHLKKFLEVRHVLSFTEEYMFANENGPPMLEQGSAYIDIDVRSLVYMRRNESTLVAYAIFTASGVENYRTSLEGLCGAQKPWTSWSSNVSLHAKLSSWNRIAHIFGAWEVSKGKLTNSKHFDIRTTYVIDIGAVVIKEKSSNKCTHILVALLILFVKLLCIYELIECLLHFHRHY